MHGTWQHGENVKQSLTDCFNERTDMDCIVCGFEAGYNRAVVDVDTETEIGRFCMNCERREFGRRLELQEASDPSECSFCDAESSVALPRLDPAPIQEGDRIINTVMYDLRDTTPRLCRTHYENLRNAGAEQQSSATGGGI